MNTLKEKIEALRLKSALQSLQVIAHNLAIDDVIALLPAEPVKEHAAGVEQELQGERNAKEVMYDKLFPNEPPEEREVRWKWMLLEVDSLIERANQNQPPADIAHQAAGVDEKWLIELIEEAIDSKHYWDGSINVVCGAKAVLQAIRPYLTPVSAQPTVSGESNLQPVELSELENRIAGWEEWIECEPPNIKSTLEAATLIHELYRLIRAPSAEACRKAFERETGLIWGEKGGEYAQDHFVGGWKAALQVKK